jgi:signal peptidase I
MKHQDVSTATSDITRDFTYEEKPRLSPNWQLALDIGETIILTILMFFVIRLAVQNYQVEGTSMLPTLQNNQFVLVDKLTYHFSSPQRGDVIVFAYPLNPSVDYIKRIIGLPGDHVTVAANGQVSVNGVAIQETYVNNLDNQLYEDEGSPYLNVTLPANDYYVLGDNRGGSSDSRDWGLLPQKNIIGKATLVYWPFASFHLLPNEHPTFQQVPAAIGHLTIPTARRSPGVVTSADLFNNSQPLLALFLLGMPPVTGLMVQARKRRR